MIDYGVEQYVKEHGGKPAAFVLHPAHLSEFFEGTESDDAILDGISVIHSPWFGMSVFVNERGNIFEL
ncbi:hypothetical protein C7402_103202 [Paraburkholderia unamae]|uniref:Uncharacterized protein n=1 Tax=Paraburkholderia unamae TaxID=219649 RepID=A0ABX5KUD0_9BURK|nr:hypothetical protein C7402_103202 [Paraburkholderia unamae]